MNFKIVVLSLLLTYSCQSQKKAKLDEHKSLEEFSIIKKEKLKGMKKTNGEIIIPVKYSEIIKTGIGYLTYDESIDKYGLYDLEGYLVLKTKYDGIYSPYLNTSVKNLFEYEIGNLRFLSKWDKIKGVKILVEINTKNYRLNFLEHKYFKTIDENEILFCLLNLNTDKHEKLYLYDKNENWIDVSSNDKYFTSVNKYFNSEIEEVEPNQN